MRYNRLPFSLMLILIFTWPFFITSAQAQWATDPNVNNVICNATLDQLYPIIVSDGSSGAIISWHDNRNSNTDANIYVQRINSSGVLQWTVNGAIICDVPRNQDQPSLVSDGAGGAIVTWSDYRDIGRLYDIYAQRINAAGAVQWTANGIPVCNITAIQHSPVSVSDGSGGAIIAWNDARDGGTVATNIYIQKINSSGIEEWQTNGIVLCNALGEESFKTIVSDGNGGAIIIWEDGRDGGSFNDIYAQRINSMGVVQWTTNGVEISNDSSSVIPTAVSDGSGGAIITWMDARNGITANHIYAQRIDSTGNVQWVTNGVAVCNAQYGGLHPTIASDGSGGAIITWEDLREGALNFDIYAQKIDSSGVVQWTENGVAICNATGSQVTPIIENDGSGGAIITWGDKRGGGIFGDIYAQKINSAGIVQWTANGVAISTASRDQNTPTLIDDGSGGAIITWGDSRNDFASSFDIYAQQVNTNGNLGVVTGITKESDIATDFILTQNYPNPFNPSTKILFAVPERSNVIVKVYDITGSEVITLVNKEMEAGWHSLDFNANGFASGVYLVIMNAGSYINTKKMVLLR